jgi:hypothetical protein
MRTKSFPAHLFSVCIIAVALNLSAIASSASKTQDKPVSEAEAKAANTIQSAPDIDAKMAAAEAFVKKYPQSTVRHQIAEYVASQILNVSDGNQKLTLAQRYQTIFTDKADAGSIKPAMIDAYVKVGRLDEAFAAGATHLASNPEDIQVLVLLAFTGVDQARQSNSKFVNVSGQYGAKAIEMIEGDKKPAAMDAGFWTQEKAMLAQLYEQMVLIDLLLQKPADAQVKLEKAIKLAPNDPYNYFMMGNIVNDEYQKMAQTYKSMPAGKEQEDMLVKINAKLDAVIDLFARAVALSEGKPQYKVYHDQTLHDLTAYYSYRHNKSTEGLQKLIDSYKVP